MSVNYELKIAQGIEMGRPSSLKARTQKKMAKLCLRILVEVA